MQNFQHKNRNRRPKPASWNVSLVLKPTQIIHYTMKKSNGKKIVRYYYGSIPREEDRTPLVSCQAINIDDAYRLIGHCGRFQVLLHLLAAYLVMTIGYHFILGFFMGDDPPWKCVTRNSTNGFCMLYYNQNISKESVHFYQRCKMKRKEWTYTRDKSYSFVTEFDLVCENTAIASMIRASFYIGGLLGALIAGSLADIMGRKIVILVSLTLIICVSISCTFVSSILTLSVLRGVLGSAHVACYFTAYVYLTEFSTPKNRSYTSNVYIMSLTSSFLIIDLISYFNRNWRQLELYASLPSLLALIAFYMMPESPRWLLATNKIIKAKSVMERIASFNGKQLDDFSLEEVPCEGRYYSYLDLFRSTKVMVLTAVLGALWATIALVYYTVALESSSLGGDMYQSFAILAIVDFPGYLTTLYVINRFGRKKTVLFCLMITGIFIGAIAALPQTFSHKYTVIIAIIIISKYFISIAFTSIYSWTFEIFPTVLRSQGISVCIIFERVGLISVPFLTTVLQSIYYDAPFLFMFILIVFASMVGLILPETNNTMTREKYEDFFEERETILNEESTETIWIVFLVYFIL